MNSAQVRYPFHLFQFHLKKKKNFVTNMQLTIQHTFPVKLKLLQVSFLLNKGNIVKFSREAQLLPLYVVRDAFLVTVRTRCWVLRKCIASSEQRVFRSSHVWPVGICIYVYVGMHGNNQSCRGNGQRKIIKVKAQTLLTSFHSIIFQKVSKQFHKLIINKIIIIDDYSIQSENVSFQ